MSFLFLLRGLSRVQKTDYWIEFDANRTISVSECNPWLDSSAPDRSIEKSVLGKTSFCSRRFLILHSQQYIEHYVLDVSESMTLKK